MNYFIWLLSVLFFLCLPFIMLPPAGQSAEDSWKPFYVTGDLFSCPADDALAHCISEDCHMGAGIAVTFRQKFGGVSELKEQSKSVWLKTHLNLRFCVISWSSVSLLLYFLTEKVTGQCAVLKQGRRFIYYLVNIFFTVNIQHQIQVLYVSVPFSDVCVSDYEEKILPETHLWQPGAQSGRHEVSLRRKWSDKNIDASVSYPASPVVNSKKVGMLHKRPKKNLSHTV